MLSQSEDVHELIRHFETLTHPTVSLGLSNKVATEDGPSSIAPQE